MYTISHLAFPRGSRDTEDEAKRGHRGAANDSALDALNFSEIPAKCRRKGGGARAHRKETRSKKTVWAQMQV